MQGSRWPAGVTLMMVNVQRAAVRGFVLAAALTVAAEKPAAGDWPVFRGDAALTGVSSEALSAPLELRWTFKTGDEIKSSAVIAGNNVFVGSTDGKLYALALDKGKVRWTFTGDSAIEAPPMLAGDVVVVGSLDGTLYALEAQNGKQKWAYRTEAQIVGSANLVRIKGQDPRVVVGSHDCKLHCVELGSGKGLWSHETGSFINGAPAVDAKRVVFGGCDAVVHALSPLDGKVSAGVETDSYIAGSIALANNRAYFGHYGNKVVCVDLEQARTVWEYGDEEDGEPFLSSPAVTATHVVIGGRDGKLYALDRDSGKLRWAMEAHGSIDGSPVVCGDKVVVGSNDGRLYLVRLSDGKALWTYEVGSALTASPAVSGGMVVIGAEDGSIYAFGAAK